MRNNRLICGVMVLGVAAAVGCSDDEADKEPIKIGLVSPQTGALQFVGESFADVFTAAIAEINSKGGVNGHLLEAVIKDTATDPAVAAAAVQEMIDEGVVAAVGPATSGSVDASYPVARDNMFPIISPSSTAPGLAEVSDGGFMFRNVPNDNIQGVAMAYYLTAVRTPTVSTVAIVQENSPYGDGLAKAFTDAFMGEGGMVVGTVKYTQNDADTGQILTDLAALSPAPEVIMMVALEQDALAIVNAWDADGSTLPSSEWFLTDGARSSGFLAGLPASLVGSEGTAPTFPILGDAYGEVEDAFMDAQGRDIAQEVFGPNVWDATYLIAAGLLVQDAAGEEFGGTGLRDAITDVSHGPGVVLHAGQWRDITTTVNSGNDIDYDGAAGPNDFDVNGEAVGPYEVWRVIDNGGTLEFEQVLFLEAGDVEDLINSN